MVMNVITVVCCVLVGVVAQTLPSWKAKVPTGEVRRSHETIQHFYETHSTGGRQDLA